MKTTLRRRIAVIAASTAVLATGFALAGCSSGVSTDQAQTNSQLIKYERSQPTPQFDYSQYRQTIINVESAEAHGVATTTFMFDQGVATPVMSCPSLGYPIASTAQLTNPQQNVGSNGAVVAQMEPTGVYTGDSTGTYVTCVGTSGKTSVDYWEGFVYTVGGPAHWDATAKQVVADGAPTVSSDAKK